MAYSNDYTQIRAGLVNYAGALLQASHFQGPAAQQEVVATLTEEALKLCQDENKLIQLYQAKPILRSMVFILKQRNAELSKLPKTKIIDDQIAKYNSTIETLEDMINSIK